MPRTGRRPGPSSTRAQITEAAARRFTATGYDATSLRQVAADAGVDPALIRRFFGGKEQLFSEVASALIDPGRALAIVAGGPPGAAPGAPPPAPRGGAGPRGPASCCPPPGPPPPRRCSSRPRPARAPPLPPGCSQW